MNPTQKARRADALRLDVEHVYRRDLCDMVVNREADLEDARAEIATLREQLAADGRTCKLVAVTHRDRRRRSDTALDSIECSVCHEQHTGMACFDAGGAAYVYRDPRDLYCRHCGARITNQPIPDSAAAAARDAITDAVADGAGVEVDK